MYPRLTLKSFLSLLRELEPLCRTWFVSWVQKFSQRKVLLARNIPALQVLTLLTWRVTSKS